MKAIVCTRYGPPEVLQLEDVPKPSPADNEVLVKIYAASLNPLDSYTVKGPSALLPILGSLFKGKPRIPGSDIAGRVEAVGKSVTQFQPGDKVFGALFESKRPGGFAEYACSLEDKLAPMPANASFEEAAGLPIAALTALQGLRDKGAIRSGHKVLIDGASGGVGTFAIQIAKSFGAEVTAVCSSRNIDRTRSLGADQVIDYTREDFTHNGLRYDLILGANAHHSVFDYRRALTGDGVFVMVGGDLAKILQFMLLAPLLTRIGGKAMRFFIAKVNTRDLVFLKNLVESGKLVTVIDRRYTLSQLPEALRYREEGHAQGKVVITVDPDRGV